MGQLKHYKNGQWVTDSSTGSGSGSGGDYSQLSSEITDLQNQLNTTNDYIDNAFHDGIISRIELEKIRGHLQTLEAADNRYTSEYDKIYNNTDIDATSKSALQTAKSSYDTAFQTLESFINGLTDNEVVTAAMQTTWDNDYSTYLNAINILSSALQVSLNNIAQAKADNAESNAKTYTDNSLAPIQTTVTSNSSSITQNQNEIALKVDQTTYTTDITGIQNNITDLQNTTSATNTYIDGSFKDGIIQDAEYRKIQGYLNTLASAKADYDNQYTNVDSNSYLSGTDKTNLESAKSGYDSKYNALITEINNAIADQKATPDESTAVDSAFSDYQGAIALLATMMQAAIDAIAKAKANEAETNAKDYADTLKSETDSSITSVQTSVTNLNTYVDGSFRDGVITETESNKIKSYLNIIANTKANFDQKYDAIYNNTELGGSLKTDLASDKTSFDSAYNNLVTSINTAIGDSAITSAESADVDTKFSTFNDSTGVLQSKLDFCIDYIAQQKATSAQTGAQDYTDAQIQPITTRLTSAESSITENANNITLKVDQTDYEQTITGINQDKVNSKFSKNVAINKSVTYTGGTEANGSPTSQQDYGSGRWNIDLNSVTLPQSMTVDLGAVIDEIVNVNFTAYPTTDVTATPDSFTVEYSTDNTNWSTVINVAGNTNTKITYNTAETSVRYVRLTVTKGQSATSVIKITNFQVISYQGMEKGDALKMHNGPTEAGADVTGNNTAKDTSNVNGTPAVDITTRLTEAESSITQNASSIDLKVSKTTYTQDITNIQNTANAWAQKLTEDNATFTRASVAYDDAGNQVANDTPRYKIVGKNLIDPSGILYRSNDGSVTVNNYGITVNSKTAELAGYLIPVQSSSPYTFSASSLQSTGSRIIEFDTKPTDPSQTNVAIHTDFTTPCTFTTSSTTSWIFVGVYASTSQLGQFWTNMQLEEGATANPFEPFNQGILQEEGTTNLFTNTNGTATSMTAGGTTPPTATLVSDSTNPFGSQAWEVTFPAGATSGYAGCRVQSNTWTYSANQTYSSTVWIKGMTNDIAAYHTGAFALPGMTKTGRSINGYEEFTATGTVGSVAGSNYLVVYAYNSPTVATTVHIAVSQVENKSYATSYTDSTRAMESLFITTDVLNSSEWTASVEFEFFHPDIVPFWRMPLSSWTKFYLGVSPSTSNLRLSWIDETGTQQTINSGAVSLNLTGLNTVSIRSNSGTVDVFINGVKAITASTSLPSIMEATNILRIGGLGSGVSYPANSYFSNLKVSSIARTDDELANPTWEADGFTTAYMDFEGNIQYQYYMSASDYTDKQIAPINTTLTTVEEQITADAIVNTVTTSESYSNDMNNKANTSDLSGLATTDYANNAASTAESNANAYTEQQLGTIDLTNYVQKTQTIQSADDIVTSISKSGGINLIKNSVGFAGLNFWTLASGTMTTEQSSELDSLGFGSGFYSGVGATLDQTFNTIVGTTYTISFYLRKEVDNSAGGYAGVNIYDGSTKLSFVGLDNGQGVTIGDSANSDNTIIYGYKFYTYTWTASQPTAEIEIYFGGNTTATITGVMASVGSIPLSWQLSAGELYNTSVSMDLNGIKVAHLDANGAETGFTVMTPDKFAGYYDANKDGIIDESDGSVDEVFRMDAQNFIMTNAVVKNSFTLDTIQIIKINASGHTGWAFVGTSST